jgi:protein-S-isoprenylcysteine O-methyltransferase Ste14
MLSRLGKLDGRPPARPAPGSLARPHLGSRIRSPRMRGLHVHRAGDQRSGATAEFEASASATIGAATELVARTVTFSMRTTVAALGSAAFLVLAPGTVAGLVPFLMTGWVTHHPPVVVFALGALLLAAGAVVLLHAFARFVIEGVGTPSPVAPTERLVVGGLYRHVRNPTYLAVTATIVGPALLLGQFGLLAYAALFLATTMAFVTLCEEPSLRRQFARNTMRTAPPFRAGGHVYTPGVGGHQAPAAPANRTCEQRCDPVGRRAPAWARGLRHLLRPTRASSGAADAPCNARQWRPQARRRGSASPAAPDARVAMPG